MTEPAPLTPIEKTMWVKLESFFNPLEMALVNQSHLHAGHQSSPETGHSHFNLTIRSTLFTGKNRVARQRLIMDCLREELKGPVHALSIKALAPEE